jgi:hypothetical protein
MENNNTTSKLIRGDESVENQSGTSSPSDGASCSESLFVKRCEILEDISLKYMQLIIDFSLKHKDHRILTNVEFLCDGQRLSFKNEEPISYPVNFDLFTLNPTPDLQ